MDSGEGLEMHDWQEVNRMIGKHVEVTMVR